MWYSALLSFLVVYSLGDDAITTDQVALDVAVSDEESGMCDVALDVTDLTSSPGTYVIAQDDPLADVNILMPMDIPGAEAGLCSSTGTADVCTYGWSGDESVDWMVDVEVPVGQSTISVVDASSSTAEVVAEVGIGCTCQPWGDFDLDGNVGAYDLVILLGSFGNDATDDDDRYLDAPEWFTGVPADGVIDQLELTFFLSRYNLPCPE